MRLILLLVLAAGMLTLAEAPSVAAAQSAADRVTIIVLDQSGSMLLDAPDATPPTKASDLRGLRCSAVRLLADLATSRDALGLIRLETSSANTDDLAAQTVVSPPLAMGTREAREQFRQLVRCDDARHNTPIADALTRAYAELSQAREERSGAPFTGQVLLLTDGTPAPQSQRQRAVINQLLPNFAAHGWPIHTIGLRLTANGKPEAITLLRSIAGRSGGTAYGDVDDPLDLQRIFLQFFAQQTGRSLLPGNLRRLGPKEEQALVVPAYATRIDVLVARDTPDAVITLHQPGPSYAPVSEGTPGVVLVSADDDYYTAFLIERPLAGTWSVRSDRPTGVIVNLLVESDISIQVEDTDAPRAANAPLLLEARFYARDAAGTNQPAAIQAAEVAARVSLGAEVQELRLRDDGQPPDAIANDSLYSGALPPRPDQLSDPLPVTVAISARTGSAEYHQTATLQLIPVPTLVLAPDAIRITPDQPIAPRLELRLGGKPVPPDGWRVVLRQMVGDIPEERPTRPDGIGLVAELTPLDTSKSIYQLEADLIGIEQNQGLERLRQPLALSVEMASVLRLVLDDFGARPAGRPITVMAALLRGYGPAEELAKPPRLQLERAGAVAHDIPPGPGPQPGIYQYRFTPEQPGSYQLRLLPPAGVPAPPVTSSLEVVAVPELRWGAERGTDGALSLELQSWEEVDWGLFARLGIRHSEPLTLTGSALRDGRPYTGSLTVELRGQSGELLDRFAADTGQVVIERPLDGGTYQLVSHVDDLFAPEYGCCESAQPLNVVVSPPGPALVWAARGQLASGVSGAALLLLLARYLWLYSAWLVLLPGDQLIYSVDGREQPVGLRAVQGWRHFLFPGRVVLSQALLQRRVYRGKKPLKAIQPVVARQVRRLALEVNGLTLPASNEQSGGHKVLKDGTTVRYLPSRKRLPKRKERPSSGKGGSRGRRAGRSLRRPKRP